jgi:CHASE3 domain sensor protein
MRAIHRFFLGHKQQHKRGVLTLIPPISKGLRASRRLPFWVGLAGLVVVALSALAFDVIESRVSSDVSAARELVRVARDARLLAVDQETGLRGYMLSGRDVSLAPKLAADKALKLKLDTLSEWTRSTPSQRAQIANIRNALARWDRGFVIPTLASVAAGNVPRTNAGNLR